MKPQSIAPNYETFPAELRNLPVWLVWNHRLIDGRWTKVPRCAAPEGGPAATDDPTTWRSFDEAVRIGKKASGIGLCFTNDYAGIDLDCCRNKVTGEIVPWARKIVELLNSYTEVSPSGEGLHIIIRLTQQLPEGRRKWGGKDKGWEIAVYDKTSPRYFCVTGVILEGRAKIRSCEPSTFYPQFAKGDFEPEWAKAKSTKTEPQHPKANGHDKKASLLRGDWQGLYPSQSEADAALVWFLAEEFGNDPVVVDREFRKSGLMRPKWDKPNGGGTYGARTIANCLTKKSDPVASSPRFSEDALALRFTRRHAANVRYVAAWGRWMNYDGTRWAEDSVLSVFDKCRAICREVSEECMVDNKNGLAKQLMTAATVAAVQRLATWDQRTAAVVSQWDTDNWLLNTPGGALDLHTGTLREHRREDYCTKITAVAPSGECRRWRQFLARITDGDQDLESFLQRMVGYCLTGSTREECLFFLYGHGANGKSKFLSAISGMLGDYAQTAPIDTFIASSGEHHPTDLAGLRSARLVTSIETEEGRRWAEAKIKQLTGGDVISARFMRQDFFEFTPQFKLLIAGNHKPSLRSVNEAIRRRFHLVPFQVTIPEAERDLELGEKLRRRVARDPEMGRRGSDRMVEGRAESSGNRARRDRGLPGKRRP